MLRTLFKGLLGAGAHPAGAPLIEDADLDPGLPAKLREFVSRASEEAARGNSARALAQLDRARKMFPQSAWPVLMQALVHEREGRTAEAERRYAEAVALDAALQRDDSVAQRFHTRGLIHLRAESIPQARRCFELAHRLFPQGPAPLEMLGFAGYFDGDIEAAHGHYDRALAVARPDIRGLLRLNRMIDTLPQILPPSAGLEKERSEFSRELDELLVSPPRIDDPLLRVHRTVFYLCYQGRNDLDLNRRVARLFLRSCPELEYVAPHAGRRGDPPVRRRVGFVSTYLGRHSVGVWYARLVRLIIESGRFECVLFTYRNVDDALKSSAEAHGRHVFLDQALGPAREQIEACQLDILIYTDVGMHPYLYFLSFARLAPIQALLVGHPCTSGVPAIDYFISNVYQDHDGAQAHYSERLVRLPVIPVYVEKNAPPATRMTRAELGWSDETRIYFCPMMLQKLHPDFDWALAEILRRDPQAEVVLIGSNRRPRWEEQLERRFAAGLPDVAARIVFRPFAQHEEFLNLLALADCVLDPFHFSGGVTTYIAFSIGVPVVTLPGELFRSRMTAGIYEQAGVSGCTASSREHFVELALEFARNPALRTAKGAQIVAAHPRIFETRDAVDALADWIDTVVAERLQ